MSNLNQPRVPPGTSAGGRWTTKPRDESDGVSLSPPNTAAATVAALRGRDDRHDSLLRERLRLSKESNDGALLAALADDTDFAVASRVAKNPATPPEALLGIAHGQHDIARTHVATNPNTPPEALMKLASDEREMTRFFVGRNPNATPEVLAVLAQDTEQYIREAAQEHENWRD